MTEPENIVVISPRELADWLDGQPDSWWWVDGDPVLTSEVDFPCPYDELSEALRKHKNEIHLYPRPDRPLREDPGANRGDLDDLMDLENPRGEKMILARWKGSDIDWLLIEDKKMAEKARRETAETMDAKTKD